MKLKAFLPGLAAVVLSGCSIKELASIPPDPKIGSAFSADCSVTAVITPPDKEEQTEFSFGGRLRRLGTGFWELEISSPDSLAGMKITRSDGNVTASLGELKLEGTAEDIPDKSPFMALFNTLDSAASSDIPIEQGKEGGWVINGGSYSIVLDGSGVPVSMAVSSPELTIDFSAFDSGDNTEETVSGT